MEQTIPVTRSHFDDRIVPGYVLAESNEPALRLANIDEGLARLAGRRRAII